MTLRFACGSCGKRLSAPENKAGIRVSCPGCRGILQIPFPSGAVAIEEDEEPPPRRQAAPKRSQNSKGERRIDLAMLSVLDTLIEDPVIFKWASQQLEGDEEKLRLFQRTYLTKKKNKATAHLLNLIAIPGIGGLHRFYLGDIGLGVAHLLTFGFCFVGTIVDIFAINKRVNQANVRIALQTLEIVAVS